MQVLSFFQSPTFLLIKIPREGNWVLNKIPSCSNSALEENCFSPQVKKIIFPHIWRKSNNQKKILHMNTFIKPQSKVLVNLPKSGRDIPLTAVLRCQFLATSVWPTLIVGLNTLKKKRRQEPKTWKTEGRTW